MENVTIDVKVEKNKTLELEKICDRGDECKRSKNGIKLVRFMQNKLHVCRYIYARDV